MNLMLILAAIVAPIVYAYWGPWAVVIYGVCVILASWATDLS